MTKRESQESPASPPQSEEREKLERRKDRKVGDNHISLIEPREKKRYQSTNDRRKKRKKTKNSNRSDGRKRGSCRASIVAEKRDKGATRPAEKERGQT